ncbi:MAG: MarR family transcriptional regulator [Dehalococcoidia bacterium]|nr:MarR family transcriptional regulator [Dehalococcoidia bacterium]
MKSEGSKSELVHTVQSLQERLEELEFAITPIIPHDWLTTDLTMPQLKVMVILWREGPARMSELASGLAVTLATATGVVDRLVEKGYVVREGLPGDRRVVICRLSQEGQEFMKALWLSGRVQIGRILEVMTPEQLRIVAQGLEVFIEAAKKVQSASGSKKAA